jgi:integrase/recombinase XerD
MIPFRYAELHDTGPRWYVHFYALNPDSGKLQRVRHYINSQKNVALRKKLATQMIHLINSKLDQGWNPFISDSQKKMFVPLKTALENALKYKARYVRPRSLPNYQSRIHRLIDYLKNRKQVDIRCGDFTSIMAQDYMTHLLQSENISPTTFNNYLTDYRTFFNYLVKTRHCNENVFRSVDLLPETQKRKRPFTDQEQIRYREYLEKHDHPFLIISLLCYFCGLRPGEMCQLQIRDISIKRQMILVSPQISKNKKQRMIPVADAFWPMLLDYIKGAPGDHYLISRQMKIGSVKILPQRIAERFRQIAIQLGFDQDLKFYSLKDTCADNLDQSGYSTKTIRDLFGHHSIAVTDAYMKQINTRALDQLRMNFPDFGK